MPESNKIKKDEMMVDIDTSGPETEVSLPEDNIEQVTTEKETKNEETIKEPAKLEDALEKSSEQPDVQASEKKEEDEKLEDYSKGVQSRIAKLTRKMREAERREQAATEYAKAVEAKRKLAESKYEQINNDYVKQFDTRVTTGMDSAQKELAMAIEAGDAAAQVEANKKIATLSIDAARLNVLKDTKVETPKADLSQDANVDRQTPQALPTPDPQAEAWASKNSWFGQDRAMTFTAFEIHKELVDNEGYDPKSPEYYAEIDKRIKVDFPHKFGNTETNTSKPVQSVASANRSVKPGRKTVRLTSSQVAIAKKLGVPLEEYAKQIKLTEGA